MQKPFQHTLTESDRTTLTSWLLGLLAFYGVVAIVILGLTLAGARVKPDGIQQTTGANSSGGISARLSSSGSSQPYDEFSTGMPLP